MNKSLPFLPEHLTLGQLQKLLKQFQQGHNDYEALLIDELGLTDSRPCLGLLKIICEEQGIALFSKTNHSKAPAIENRIESETDEIVPDPEDMLDESLDQDSSEPALQSTAINELAQNDQSDSASLSPAEDVITQLTVEECEHKQVQNIQRLGKQHTICLDCGDIVS